MAAGLVDTSVLIAAETGRPLGQLPDAWAVSTVTLGELHLGVMMAETLAVRGRRLATLTRVVDELEMLPFDADAARAFGSVVAEARRAGRRPRIMDSLIAATALRYDLPLYTQDADFEAFPGITVVRV